MGIESVNQSHFRPKMSCYNIFDTKEEERERSKQTWCKLFVNASRNRRRPNRDSTWDQEGPTSNTAACPHCLESCRSGDLFSLEIRAALYTCCLQHPPPWPVYRQVSDVKGRHVLGGPHTPLCATVVRKRVLLAAVRYQDEIIWVPSGAWQCVWYVARVCQYFLYDEYIDDIDWPARSPGLNSTQHLWDHTASTATMSQNRLCRSWLMSYSRFGRRSPRITICQRQNWAIFWPVLGWICLWSHFFTLVSNINLNPVLSGLLSLGPHWLFLYAIVKEWNISSINIILFYKEIWGCVI